MDEQNQQAPQPQEATPAVQSSKKDFLAPALVFIALFFAFFVLITMQRLTKQYTGEEPKDIPAAPIVVTTGDGMKETTESQPTMNDSEKPVDTVGDEILEDIDATQNDDLDSVLGTSDLDELAE